VKYLTIKKLIFQIFILVALYNGSSYACLPTATITQSALNICTTNASATFYSTIAFGGTSPTYLWYKNRVSTGITTANASLTGLQNNDTIWCQLTSNDPCATPTNVVNSNQLIILFSPLIPLVTISHTPSVICQNTLTTFKAVAKNAGTAATYSWKKNAITVGNFATYTTNSLNNNDSVWCVITSNDPCVVTNNAKSNVEIMMLTPISAQAGLDQDLCIGDYCFVGSSAGAGLKYKWVPATGLSYDNISSPTASPTVTTTYTLTVSTLSGSCTRTDNLVINVHALPKVKLGNDTLICYGETVTLNAGANFSSYWWNTSTANQYYTVIAPYTYIVAVTDTNNCVGKDTITVNFKDCSSGFDDFENATNQLKVSPNPSQGNINIASAIQIKSIELYDLMGQKINLQFLKVNYAEEIMLDISSLPSGVYMLKAELINGKNTLSTVIKK
jgi:hypothetical protein